MDAWARESERKLNGQMGVYYPALAGKAQHSCVSAARVQTNFRRAIITTGANFTLPEVFNSFLGLMTSPTRSNGAHQRHRFLVTNFKLAAVGVSPLVPGPLA